MSDYRRRAVIASEGGGGTIAPDFSTATWAEIQAYINENGTADYAEQIGKTRPITLSDSSEHTLRLANVAGDLYELSDGSGYTGMIVEFVDIVTRTKLVGDGGDFVAPLDTIDPIGTTVLPAILATLPQDLQDIIPTVKVVTVTSSLISTLVSCDMKLFIPAMNEIVGNIFPGYTHNTEYNISARWANYVANDNTNYRKKYFGGSLEAWWMRSPSKGGSSASESSTIIALNGNMSTSMNNTTRGVSPAFCLAPQPFVPPIQPLKYIESTGTQYIDTDIASNTITNATCDMQFTHWTSVSQQEGTDYSLKFYTPPNGGGISAAGASSNIPISLDTWYNISLYFDSSNRRCLSVGSTESVGVTGSNSYTYVLFAVNNYNNVANSVALFTQQRKKNFKIYGQNDTLVRDFVPCSLTEAVTDYWGNPQAIGAVGLWDNVSRKFFPNNGMGDFVAGDPVVPVPDFATATWGEIQTYINNYGTEGFADQVGATRSVTLTDTTTQTLRLANVTGDLYELSDGTGYTGMIVEFENCLPDVTRWTFPTASNENPLGNADPMGTTTLPAVYESFPSDLKSIIPTVKVFSAKGGAEYDTTLVYSDMKVFLPSIVEVGFSAYAPATEAATLSLWEYYRVHSANADRKKQYSGGYIAWWSRSPAIRYSSSTEVFVVSSSGDLYREPSTNGRGCSPCFCLAKQPPTPTSFADDDWETIQYAIDHNLASSVYSVGDTKTITLSDNSTHTLRLVNMTGDLYELEAGGYTGFIVDFADIIEKSKFSATSTTSGTLDSINPIGTTVLPAIKALLPQDLQDILASVKVVKARIGNDTTLVSSFMDLFIPASMEVDSATPTNRYKPPDNETAVLTTWEYYATHDRYARIKALNGTDAKWWLRSPVSRYNDLNLFIETTGWGNNPTSFTDTNVGVSPCFCLAKTPPTPPDFSTDSWSDIQAYIDEYGTNGFADQVGATRSITLTDSSTHTLRLANATGNLYELADGSAYTGFIVEFMESCQISAFAGLDTNEGALATINPMGTTVLPAIKAKLPQDLQAILATVKVIKANKSTDGTLVSSNMDFFLPAWKEIGGNNWACVAAEADALTWWKYYETHSTSADRIKDCGTTGIGYWTRSPSRQTNNGQFTYIYASDGGIGDGWAKSSSRSVIPCFCLAPTSTPPAPTPTSFADDDWATIKYAVDNNLASAVYSVGDTKTIMLSNNTVHTIRIANMTGNLYEYADNAGTYTGFVMEFVDIPLLSEFAVPSSGSPGALDTIDPIGTTVLPNIEAMLPSNMASVLSTVKVLKSTSGTTKALISADMKLFLPAERELFGTRANSTTTEWNAFSRWEYYATNDTTAARTKLYNGTQNMPYWLRSPESDASTRIVRVANGSSGIESPATSAGISPCFCI